LYELGLPRDEFKDTVISDASSVGLHESQSRFWENMIARSKHFWNHFYPVFKKIAPEQFKDIDMEAWYRYINQVRPSLIRIEADELTYCLNVILRFELELALIDGEIKVSDLPRCWNEKIEQGNFTNILNWLKEHIHKYGRLMPADEIKGTFQFWIWRDLDQKEKEFFNERHSNLSEDQMTELTDKLSHIHTSEMVPF